MFFMKENGKMVRDGVLVNSIGLMVLFMKVNFYKIWPMVKVV